jgi:hypothetical protein
LLLPEIADTSLEMSHTCIIDRGNHILEEQLVLVMQWATFTENDPTKF